MQLAIGHGWEAVRRWRHDDNGGREALLLKAKADVLWLDALGLKRTIGKGTPPSRWRRRVGLAFRALELRTAGLRDLAVLFWMRERAGRSSFDFAPAGRASHDRRRDTISKN